MNPAPPVIRMRCDEAIYSSFGCETSRVLFGQSDRGRRGRLRIRQPHHLGDLGGHLLPRAPAKHIAKWPDKRPIMLAAAVPASKLSCQRSRIKRIVDQEIRELWRISLGDTSDP